MSEKLKNIEEQVYIISQPLANSMGLEIWDVEFVKEGASWFLRIYIDKEDEISIEDCENFSRTIDPLLDEKDFIKESYYLEVSSPGLERTLKRDSDLIRFLNSRIHLKLFKAIEKVKEFEGILLAYEHGMLYVALENSQQFEIEKSACAIIRLAPKFF